MALWRFLGTLYYHSAFPPALVDVLAEGPETDSPWEQNSQ